MKSQEVTEMRILRKTAGRKKEVPGCRVERCWQTGRKVKARKVKIICVGNELQAYLHERPFLVSQNQYV